MLTRRQWLKASLAAGTGFASGIGLTGCQPPPEDIGTFAATFEVSPDGVLVHVYRDVPGVAHLELETVATGATVVTDGLDIGLDTGGTGTFELTGLSPDTAYRYRIVSDDAAPSAVYAFRTAPPPDEPLEFSLLISADLDTDPLFDSQILDTMRGHDARFFLSLGDWPYADNPPGAITLEEYRARHVEARIAPKAQRFVQSFPVYAIWDDHELRNNWDGRFRVEEADRIAAGIQAWDEWFPLRDSGTPKVRYRSWRYGSLVELFMLDTRLYRSANRDPDGPDKTMLGADQLAWLRAGLTASTAPFKLVITSVPLDFGDLRGIDCWRNFRTERDALLEFIVGGDVGGVVFLSADQHWFAAHHHRVGIKEFQFGPLARGIPALDPQVPEVVARADVYNYGVLSVRAAPVPTLEVVAHNWQGQELYRETVPAGRGTLRIDSDGPRQFVTSGAHRFVGVAPVTLPYATPGTYTVAFDGEDDSDGGDLDDGGTLVLGDAGSG